MKSVRETDKDRQRYRRKGAIQRKNKVIEGKKDKNFLAPQNRENWGNAFRKWRRKGRETDEEKEKTEEGCIREV